MRPLKSIGIGLLCLGLIAVFGLSIIGLAGIFGHAIQWLSGGALVLVFAYLLGDTFMHPEDWA